MKIDSNTRISIFNKRTNECGLYFMDYLVTPVGLERIIESVITDPVETGSIIKDTLIRMSTGYPLTPRVVISRACLYLAVCCYIDETKSCKSIINTIVDRYDISINESANPADANADIKDILKEIVKEMLNRHSDTFEAMANKHIDGVGV